MRQCLYLLPIGLSLLLVACSEKNGSDEDREDGGQETPVAKSRALQGPWDDVVFTKHSSYACQSLDGTRTQFPELINDDWDYEDDEVEGDEDLRDMAIPQRNQSDDDWDDWN